MVAVKMSRESFSIYTVFDKLVKKKNYDQEVVRLFKNYEVYYQEHLKVCKEKGLCVHGKKDYRCHYCSDGVEIPKYSYR
jgi:hypothetical protein